MTVCAVMLLGGYLLKGQCLEGFDGRQYEELCYNDLQPLYDGRGIAEGTFPYINAELDEETLELRNGAIEYPVLTGVFMWASGRLVSNGNEYLRTSAFLLAPFALIAAYLLVRWRGARALMWAAAPAIVLYSFHNWDLLVVAAMVVGFWLWHRRRPVHAAVAFAVGGCFKLFPLFFVLPLVFDELVKGDRTTARKVAAAGAGTFALINLPFIIVNASGWWATYEFHRLRGPNFDAIWTWLPFGWDTPSAGPLNQITGVLTALFFLVAMGVGWWRAERDGRYPFVEVCAAMLAAFLLWNKVHSPQYTLWLLPMFVLVNVRALWAVLMWAAYSIADIVVYVGVFRYFYDFGYRGLTESTPARTAMVTGVWVRAALLLVFFAIFLAVRSRRDDALEPAFLSEAPSTLPPAMEAATPEPSV